MLGSVTRSRISADHWESFITRPACNCWWLSTFQGQKQKDTEFFSFFSPLAALISCTFLIQQVTYLLYFLVLPPLTPSFSVCLCIYLSTRHRFLRYHNPEWKYHDFMVSLQVWAAYLNQDIQIVYVIKVLRWHSLDVMSFLSGFGLIGVSSSCNITAPRNRCNCLSAETSINLAVDKCIWVK